MYIVLFEEMNTDKCYELLLHSIRKLYFTRHGAKSENGYTRMWLLFKINGVEWDQEPQ